MGTPSRCYLRSEWSRDATPPGLRQATRCHKWVSPWNFVIPNSVWGVSGGGWVGVVRQYIYKPLTSEKKLHLAASKWFVYQELLRIKQITTSVAMNCRLGGPLGYFGKYLYNILESIWICICTLNDDIIRFCFCLHYGTVLFRHTCVVLNIWDWLYLHILCFLVSHPAYFLH